MVMAKRGSLLVALLIGCSAQPMDGGVTLEPELLERLATLRYDEAPAPLDPSNRVSHDMAAARFGQRLFFETAFSGPLLDGDNDGSEFALGRDGEPGRVSCAGCHVPASGFVDTRSQGKTISLAARWVPRRTPTLLDVAFAPLFSWDGSRDSLWRQSVAVFESDREFNGGRLFAAQQTFALHRDDYETIFGDLPPLDDSQRFPPLSPHQAGCQLLPANEIECRGKPGDGADYDGMLPEDQAAVTEVAVNLGKALASYLERLRCGPSRFDAWLDGDEAALSDAEKRGAALFAGKARCIECHSGPHLSDGTFHNVGLEPEVVAGALIDVGDRGAAAGLPLAIADPLNTRGAFSDGDRGALPATVGPEMEGAFRTPSLRCITRQPSFMHTAHLRSLDEVVRFFSRGGDPTGYPGDNVLVRLDLDDSEQNDLVAFIHSLEGSGPDPSLLAP
jgi:cytochrome c peroxidase